MVTRYREFIELECECDDEVLPDAIASSVRHIEKGADIRLTNQRSERPSYSQLERERNGLLPRPRRS